MCPLVFRCKGYLTYRVWRNCWIARLTRSGSSPSPTRSSSRRASSRRGPVPWHVDARLGPGSGASSCWIAVIVASISFGSKPIPFGTVFDALFHYDSTLERPPDHPVAARAAHDRRSDGRRRARAGRRGDAGRGPQPARRSRHPRRRRRRLVVRGDRHPQLRRRHAARLRVVRLRRRGGRVGRRLRARLARPRGRDAGEARAGRRGDHHVPRLDHDGDPAVRRGDARPVPVLGGRLAGRPRRTHRRADGPVHRRRHGDGTGVGTAAERARARRRRRPVARPARRLRPAVLGRCRWCCSSARRPRPPARSRSSA